MTELTTTDKRTDFEEWRRNALPPEVIARLKAPLDGTRVKDHPYWHKPYLSGEDAIATANEIFGFGNWRSRKVEGSERVYNLSDYGFDMSKDKRIAVVVDVEVAVWTEHGWCEYVDTGFVLTGNKLHEAPNYGHLRTAVKGAVTDGTKRGLRFFGNQFGLSLYFDGALDVGDWELPVPPEQLFDRWMAVFEAAVAAGESVTYRPRSSDFYEIDGQHAIIAEGRRLGEILGDGVPVSGNGVNASSANTKDDGDPSEDVDTPAQEPSSNGHAPDEATIRAYYGDIVRAAEVAQIGYAHPEDFDSIEDLVAEGKRVKGIITSMDEADLATLYEERVGEAKDLMVIDTAPPRPEDPIETLLVIADLDDRIADLAR